MYVIPYAQVFLSQANMADSTILSVTEARQTLFGLVDQVNESHEAVTITSKRGNAVLVSEQDWKALQETLYLKSMPGVWDSIEEGIREPLDECSDELDW